MTEDSQVFDWESDMHRSSFYYRDSTPIDTGDWRRDLRIWGRLHSDPRYKRVAETTLEDGTWISTVWMGLDHAWGWDGDPLIFETMVFSSHESLDDLDQVRYSTLIEAQAGHLAVVAKWSQEGLP